jgi:transposase
MRIGIVTKKQKNKDGSVREYLYLVEYLWNKEKGYSQQKHIACLGRKDELVNQNTLDNLVESICKFTKQKKVVDILNDIDPDSAKIYGEIPIFKKLWNDLGLKNLLEKHFPKSNVDYVDTVFAMVCNRLIDPCSKRATNEWRKDVYEPNWENFELHHFYKSLDFLIKNKENMETEMFNNVKILFNCKVNVVMFDTTNISYWGEGEKAGNLLAHGHAKNKRFDLKQVTVGLIMDQEGIPLGHEVWPGNMSDKPAFKAVIDKIKTKFEIEKVILVADRGMISEDNIKHLEENKYEYILAVKMRQLSDIRQKILLNDDGFLAISKSLKAKQISEYDLWEQEIIRRNEEINRYNAEIAKEKKTKKRKKKALILTDEQKEDYKSSKKGKRRWVVCLNEVVAGLDKAKREYFQKIIENKVEFSTAKEWIVKNGYKKYVIIKDLKIELDHEKLRNDSLYDGKWALITNTDLPANELINSYKDLAIIERHFRDLKSELEIGPIYHWTEKRIRAHIFVCFLALQLKVALTKRLKEISEDLSYSEVMRDVAKVKAVECKTQGNTIVMRTNLPEKAKFAFQAVGETVPLKLINKLLKN